MNSEKSYLWIPRPWATNWPTCLLSGYVVNNRMQALSQITNNSHSFYHCDHCNASNDNAKCRNSMNWLNCSARSRCRTTTAASRDCNKSPTELVYSNSDISKPLRILHLIEESQQLALGIVSTALKLHQRTAGDDILENLNSGQLDWIEHQLNWRWQRFLTYTCIDGYWY